MPGPDPGVTKQVESREENALVLLVNTIADRIDPVLKLVTTVMERNLRGEEQETRFRIGMAWIAVTVVALVVGIAAFLTYLGKIDGATMGFLLGLVVGYVLTFIRDAIEPPQG
jgi:hypothetical protein